MYVRRSAFLTAAYAASTLALPQLAWLPRAVNPTTDPLLPTEDPFYNPGTGTFEAAAPGTILRSRTVSIGSAIPGATPALAAAYQLLYRSTDTHGNPSYAVTTVMIPDGAKLDRFLSFQVAYDAADVNCSPSYGLQLGASSHAGESTVELSALMAPFLAQGIPISAPDYELRNAAFLVANQSAFGVLDSMRAVLASTSITGISSKARVTMSGYSGGAYASEFAGEYHQLYAPEVNIIGAAIGGLPTNATNTALITNGKTQAGITASGFSGVANAFPSFAQDVQDHVLPQYKAKFAITLSNCNSDKLNASYGYSPNLAFSPILSWFDNGEQFLRDHEDFFNEVGVMGRHGIPDFPIYIWKGTADDVAWPIEDTDALVAKYCAAGTDITYARVTNGTHATSVAPGVPGAVTFIAYLYAGIAPTKCSNVTLAAAVAS